MTSPSAILRAPVGNTTRVRGHSSSSCRVVNRTKQPEASKEERISTEDKLVAQPDVLAPSGLFPDQLYLYFRK